MNLNETIEICNLLSIYGKLLTKKQQQVMDMFYYDNLSLSEISENLKITRQAVLDTVNKSTKQLKNFETELGVFKQNLKLNQFIERNKSKLSENLIKELLEIKLI